MKWIWMKMKESRISRILRQLQALEISVYAAHAGYFIILSAFPTLVLLLGLLRYTHLQAADLMNLMAEFLPEPLQPYAWDLISGTYENTSKAVLSVSALTALWSAGKGIYGLLTGLNRVYGVQERRGWLRTRLMCAVYMVLFILVLMLTLVLHVFGSTIVELLSFRGMGRYWKWMQLPDLRFFLLAAVQTVMFCVMYMYLPGEDNGFRESLPGAMLSSLGWMTVSTLFCVYVDNFPAYSHIFGSVYAVALLMLWVYACVSILFYGGALNRALKGNWSLE